MTLLDVREDWEVSLAPVPTDHLHIPMGEISDRLGELDAQQGDRRDLPLRRPQRPGGGVSRGARGFG